MLLSTPLASTQEGPREEVVEKETPSNGPFDVMELIEGDINNLMNNEEGSTHDLQRVNGSSACRSGVYNAADGIEVASDNHVVRGISIIEGVDVLEEALDVHDCGLTMVESSNIDHDEIRPGDDFIDDRQDKNQTEKEV